MADRQISIARLIRKLEEKRSVQAEKLVANGGTYEEFLMGTGKFRESRALVQYLEALIDKDDRPALKPVRGREDGPDDLDPDDEDDGEEGEGEEEQIRPTAAVRVRRRPKPRGWGS